MPDSTATAPPKRLLPRIADRAFLVLGLVLLVYVLSRFPLADVGRACLRLGPYVALTPLIAMLWFFCNTCTLSLLLDEKVPWLKLLRIRLTGDGYNALLPLAGMGGEPYKVKHLTAYAPMDTVLTALIRDRILENAVGMLFSAFWLIVAVIHFKLTGPFRFVILAYAGSVSVIGIFILVIILTSLPSRIGGKIAQWLGVSSQSVVMMPPKMLLRLLVWYFLARIAGTLECALLFWLLGLGVHPLTILFCYVLQSMAGTIGFAIPQGLGVFEGTTVYVFSVLGLPGPAGVAFALARRGRMLIVGLLGVLLHALNLETESAALVPPENAN